MMLQNFGAFGPIPQVCQDALKDSKEALATFRDLQLPECADLNV
jgi:hypothetical protein